MTNLERFKADYLPTLEAAIVSHPDEYLPLIHMPEEIARRMIAAIETKGIGSVNINSRTFKALAKRYGIKNTYKEWTPWFKGVQS